jgi:hypothetical protein
MARTSINDGAEWKGTRKTGACFYDGAYDVRATDGLLGFNAVDASPEHSCVLDPMPNSRHLLCAGPAGAGKCITWYDALPPG